VTAKYGSEATQRPYHQIARGELADDLVVGDIEAGRHLLRGDVGIGRCLQRLIGYEH
jgi:hypothetical protein